jgi:hypothetical protein
MKRQFCAACGATENLSQNDLYFDWRDIGAARDNWFDTAFAEERKITLCEECASAFGRVIRRASSTINPF